MEHQGHGADAGGTQEELALIQQRLDTRTEQLYLLVQVQRATRDIYCLPEVLDVFVDTVATELEVGRISVMLLDKKSRYLTVAASRGVPEDMVPKIKTKLGEGIAGKVARTGNHVLVTNVKSDPRVPGQRSPNSSAPSFISMPIILFESKSSQRREILGVINITDPNDRDIFSESDVELLRTMAEQIALAVDRVRDFENLSRMLKELKASEQKRAAVEREKAFQEMAAGLANGFGNTFSEILTGSQTALAGSLNGILEKSELHEILEMIEALAVRGSSALTRIRELARFREERPQETLDLNTVVKTVVEMTRHQLESRDPWARVKVNLELAPTAPIRGVMGDLILIVNNLVLNAIEAMPEGGNLTLRTEASDKVRLEVKDTGEGMDSETKAHLFDPFFSTKPKSCGLGASVVLAGARRHDGETTILSEPGQGTTCVLEFPLFSAEMVEVEPVESGYYDRESALQVLVVENDAFYREAFREVLTSRGYRVIVADNGKYGLSLFNEHPVDVVLTDLSMPGVSGWDVASEVKSKKPHVPVLLMCSWNVDSEKARQVGIDYVLPKPCPVPILLETLERAREDLRAA